MLPDVDADDGHVRCSPQVSPAPARAPQHSQSSGSWFAVVTTSSLPVSGLYPTQPQPEPWIAAVAAFTFVLNSAILVSCMRRGARTRGRTVDGAEVALDGLLERAVAELAAALRLGREVLPEERVVDVSCGLLSGGWLARTRTRATHLRR